MVVCQEFMYSWRRWEEAVFCFGLQYAIVGVSGGVGGGVGGLSIGAEAVGKICIEDVCTVYGRCSVGVSRT